MQSKKLLWIILIGIAIVIAVVAVVKLQPKPGNDATQKNEDKTKPEVVRSDVEPSLLPPQVPADIPYEKDAVVVQNYTQQAGNKNQSTRIYESGKTLAANYQIFTDYFKASGWTVMNTIDDEKLKMVFGKKGDMTLQVNMSTNEVSKKNLVDVTVVF